MRVNVTVNTGKRLASHLIKKVIFLALQVSIVDLEFEFRNIWEVLVVGWALLLVLLLCPLMMMFMHRGHKGHNHGDDTEKKHDQSHHNDSSELGSLDNYKVKQLEGEIEFLKTQNEQLQMKMDNFTHNIR